MLALLVGIMIGAVLGLTGAGGSIFAVPLLMLLLALPAQQAIGISLGAVAISAVFGALTRLKQGDIKWLPAGIFAIAGGLFAPLGNWLNRQVNEQWLVIGFSLLTTVIAYRMWQQAVSSPENTKLVRAAQNNSKQTSEPLCRLNQQQPLQVKPRCLAGLVTAAAITGVLSGLFGVGGGFLIVPALLYLTAISMSAAIATSLVVISVISLSGFISFMTSGYSISLSLLSQTAFGGIVGMTMGFILSRYIAGSQLQKLFALAMIAMAGLMLYDTFI